MKYKVGDKVRIKSLDWYNKNKNEFDNVDCGEWNFTERHTPYCGEVMTIRFIWEDYGYYKMFDSDNHWTDEMIECLVKEGSKYGTASYTVEPKSNANCITRKRVDELATKIDKELPSGNQNVWELPEGYQFVDENGNVINATKIVLEKKKVTYPKTYEECCKVMNYCYIPVPFKTTHKEELIRKFQFLLMYRDAYWKIAGEEMGLGKPWEPDWSDDNEKYSIYTIKGILTKAISCYDNAIFVFPTEEIRNAFYENFKEEIEFVKELL